MKVTKYLKPKDETRLGPPEWMTEKLEVHFDWDLLGKVDLTCFPSWHDSHSKVWRRLSSGNIFFNLDRWGWPSRSCNILGLGAATHDTRGRDPKWYNPPASYPSPICLSGLRSYITKDLWTKVTEQFNILVNWLKEIKLNGELGTKRIDFRFIEGDMMT